MPYIFASLENLVRLSLLIEKRMPKRITPLQRIQQIQTTLLEKQFKFPQFNMKCSGKPATVAI